MGPFATEAFSLAFGAALARSFRRAELPLAAMDYVPDEYVAITGKGDVRVMVPTRSKIEIRTIPIQAEKFRPDRKAFGSATLATRAVASAGPTPGISSSRLLVSCERCQAMIWRSNSTICAFSIRSWAPRAATHTHAP